MRTCRSPIIGGAGKPGGIGGLGCALAVPAKGTPATRTRRAAARVKCLVFLMVTTLQSTSHDGRFATLLDVVAHYDGLFALKLDEEQKKDLVEYLKSL